MAAKFRPGASSRQSAKIRQKLSKRTSLPFIFLWNCGVNGINNLQTISPQFHSPAPVRQFPYGKGNSVSKPF